MKQRGVLAFTVSYRFFASLLLIVIGGIVAMSCAPGPEPVIDRATVLANNASVRTSNSSTSRTLMTLNKGEKVEILEKHDNWYRVRLGERLEGWMEETTILTETMLSRIQEMAAAAQQQPIQNSAMLRAEANFRLGPDRSSPIVRRLRPGTRVDVLERVTTVRPGEPNANDVWMKVRLSPSEVGWVYGGFVEFDVPPELVPYTEERIYPAVRVVHRVADPTAGSINWYVVAEKKPRLDPHLDFDGVRVFTWNSGRQRYETAFRLRGIRGVYPLEVGHENGNPTFWFYQLGQGVQQKIRRTFVMKGVSVRELKKPSGRVSS